MLRPFGPSLLENAPRFLELRLPSHLRCSRSGLPSVAPWRGTRRAPHPLPPNPLPHHPRITPSHLTVLMLRFFAPSVLTLLPFGQSRFEPSHLTHLHLRLPRPIHRLLLPADIAPADLHLHPRKLPVIEDPRQGLHLRRPLCLLEAVVAEVDPSAAFDRRRRPAAADVAGLVLRRREGDIVCGVDRGGWLHVYTRFHIFTPGLTPRKST